MEIILIQVLLSFSLLQSSLLFLLWFLCCFLSACDHPAYRNIVLRSLPRLQILDGKVIQRFLFLSLSIFVISKNFFSFLGSLIGLTEASNEIEKQLELLVPDTTDFELSLKGLTPWIPENSLSNNLSNDFSFSIDEMMEKYPQLKETYDGINDIINEDSGHLLRLATSAISKAQIK